MCLAIRNSLAGKVIPVVRLTHRMNVFYGSILTLSEKGSMPMRILIALIAMLLISPLAFSQSTWNGLQFGMSINKAQNVMVANGINMVSADPQTLKSTSDFDIQFPGTAYPFPLIVELHFGSAGLNMIDLQLDVQEYRKRKQDITSDSEAVWLFSSVSYDSLVEKYGNPIRQEDDCKPLPSSPSWTTGCSAEWRVNNEIIGYVVNAISQEKTALIQYKPQPTQL